MSKYEDIIGRQFNKLTVLAVVDISRPALKRRYCCLCECGKETEVGALNLIYGQVKSCGCARVGPLKHGCAKKQTGAYKTWLAIIQRCTNPKTSNYHRYGGRGIQICDRWKAFQNFLSDMGERPPGCTIERINNQGGYEPGNCRWASRAEQSLNKCNSRFVFIDGNPLHISVAAALAPCGKYAFRSRIYKGWDATEAFYTPRKRNNQQ